MLSGRTHPTPPHPTQCVTDAHVCSKHNFKKYSCTHFVCVNQLRTYVLAYREELPGRLLLGRLHAGAPPFPDDPIFRADADRAQVLGLALLPRDLLELRDGLFFMQRRRGWCILSRHVDVDWSGGIVRHISRVILIVVLI